eukprot:TRINITY_DN59868_c0_g1_i1.p1 TRINITY_DN59868_c0_g1~~TRINITY_DN59868_c0_g1_i1.p1  ORF type:complete len:331 (-),score=20.49 TRINITY_DN59868_c0_g1_i1:72-1064(-)
MLLRLFAFVFAFLAASIRPDLSTPTNTINLDKLPIWLWWSYPPGTQASSWINLSMDALKRMAPPENFEIHCLNASNIKHLLPDWPAETDRLYPQAVSDVVRAGVLARYGGVYIDTDMLVASPFYEITDQLKSFDMISYTFEGQDCHVGSFSSNFIASRQNNKVFEVWYDRIRDSLKKTCAVGDEVCCYRPSGVIMEQCRLPWGGLGERIAYGVLKSHLQKDPSFRIHCYTYENNEGFAPCWNCLWGTPQSPSELNGQRCDPHGENNLSLRCEHGSDSYDFPNFFGRRAYHLFSSIAPEKAKQLDSCSLLHGRWTVSQLLRSQKLIDLKCD